MVLTARSVTDSTAAACSPHTASASCSRKNVKFHRINNTDMLPPSLQRPLRAPCLWGLAPQKHGRLCPSGAEGLERTPKAEQRVSLCFRASDPKAFSLFFLLQLSWAGACLELIFCKQGHGVVVFFFPFVGVASSWKSHKINELFHGSFWARERAFYNIIT